MEKFDHSHYWKFWNKIFSVYLDMCTDNKDFLHKIQNIEFMNSVIEMDTYQIEGEDKNIILNKSELRLVINDNKLINPYFNWTEQTKNNCLNLAIPQHRLNSIWNKDYNLIENMYTKNKLHTSRLGNIESSFILKYYYKMDKMYFHDIFEENNQDIHMKKQAGLYYKNNNRKIEVLDWWCKNTLRYISKENTTLSYSGLYQYWDLILFSCMDLKNKKMYNYGEFYKMVLKNSGGKKILYIGAAVKSITAAYNRGVQKAWNFKVPEFDLYCVQTPQTTLGMSYPDDSIIETTQKIVDQIVNNYSDFDTAILGCGAYGPPIMNILSDKFSNKNMLYLGSDCYKMFGIYSDEMPTTYIGDDGNLENWIEVLEEYNDSYACIDNGKYWNKKDNSDPIVEKQDKSKKNKLFYYLLLIFLFVKIVKK